MKTMTLNIDIPTGLNVDVPRLKAMATNYVQQYVYMLQNVYQTKKNRKSTAAFRSMRGSLSSNNVRDFKEARTLGLEVVTPIEFLSKEN